MATYQSIYTGSQIDAAVAATMTGMKTAPDWGNSTQVLSTAGTFTATADGYVQRLSGITNASTVYIVFSTLINGSPAEINEHEGLQSAGIYNWVSVPIPVKAGDIVTISSSGGGTGTVLNALAFMPPR